MEGLWLALLKKQLAMWFFKVLAKKRSLMTSDIVAYGFGHGLSEFIFLGVMGLLTNIIVLRPSIQVRPVSYLQLL